MKQGLLNPLYIEQYGLTYKNPDDFSLLVGVYGSQDTSKKLYINYDTFNLEDMGALKGRLYALERASRLNFKPFYYKDSVGLDNKNVVEHVAREREHFGKSIRQDKQWMRAILNNCTNEHFEIKPLKQKGKNYYGGNWFDIAAGYWWGSMNSGVDNDFFN